MSMPVERKRYRAFISYSQKDSKQAQALHRALESYRVPLGISPDAIKSKRRLLGKFFRDTEDMSAAADISATVRGAIEDSESLIVLCSPRSAGSRWVETEVQHFRRTGRGDRIFAVIVDGIPNSGDPVTECFPPSLRLDAGPDLHPDDMPVEPVGIDMRLDGIDRVRARIAAGLLGVPFDQLWQRRRREAIREWWIRGGVAAGVLAVAALALINVQSSGERRVALARSDALANIAQDENELKHFDAAGRYALAAMRGRNAIFSGFAPRHARAELMRAVSGGQAEAVIAAHDGPVYGVAVTADGARFATWSEDGVAKIWDRVTLAPVHALKGHQSRIWNAFFSPDGARLATASSDNSVMLWDVRSGARLAVIIAGKLDALCNFSGDGRYFATASDDGAVRLWTAGDGKLAGVLRGPPGSINDIAFSPDSARLAAVGEDGVTRLWSVANRRLVTLLHGHIAPVGRVAFSADSRLLATGGDDSVVRLWDSGRGRARGIFYGLNASVAALAFSPDGRSIAAGDDDGGVLTWKLGARQTALPLAGHVARILTLAYSPDGESILTTADDESARLWDAASGGEWASLEGHRGPVEGGVFTPDGAHVLTVSDDRTVRLWRRTLAPLRAVTAAFDSPVDEAVFDAAGARLLTMTEGGAARVSAAADGHEIFTVDGLVLDAAFTADGARLLTLSPRGVMRVHDSGDGHVLHTIAAGASTRMLPHPDGAHVAVAGLDGAVRVWGLSDTRPQTTLTGHKDKIYMMAFSPDGAMLATASHHDLGAPWDVRIWDTVRGRLITRLADAPSGMAIVFNHDGSRLMTVDSAAAKIWDTRAWKAVATLGGHEGAIRTAAFSPDGARIATAGEDRTARLWRASDGQFLLSLVGHVASIVDVTFSPDGARVLTASFGASARVWDAATGREMMQLKGPGFTPLRGAAFSPDGRSVVTASEDGTARLWDVGVTTLDDARLVERACKSIFLHGLSRFQPLELERARGVDRRTPQDVC